MAFDLSPGISRLHASLARCLTEDTHQGVVATDAQLRVALWNRWMEIHSGSAAGDVIGRSILDVCPDLVERGIREYYEGALEGRVTILSHALHRYVLALPASNPEIGWMPQSGRIGPLVDGGQIVGTVTTIEDVSDRVATEGELRKQIEAQEMARATAEKALRAKDEFLSTLSHEIRTPLNAVLGWVRILLGREAIDPALLSRGLTVIERNASAQAELIEDMLDMARIVAGKLRLEMQPVDLVGVILAAVDVVMPSANAKSIKVRTSLDPRTPRVLGDQDRLQQVVWNLLSNAVKFSEHGSAIDVRLEAAGKIARIVVEDSGRGISPEFLPYVFERFRQGDSSSGRRHAGLGLGLALVRDLVDLHGGSVSVYSAGEGGGSTFTIELPTVISPEVRRNHVTAVASAGPSLHGVRVLLVEDEADARDLSVAALEYAGAVVTAVSSSADALTWLLAQPTAGIPNVIVSDIGMPKQDGYDLIRRIRALPGEHRRTPAIAVTGYATPDDARKAFAAGFQRHVSKPVDPSVLIEAVAAMAANGPLTGEGGL